MKVMPRIFSLIVFLCFIGNSTLYSQVSTEPMTKENMVVSLYNVYYWDDEKDPCLYEKTEELCLEILEKDSLNRVANYYLGLLYYNEAVFINNSSEQLTSEQEQKARDLLAKSKVYFARIKKDE